MQNITQADSTLAETLRILNQIANEEWHKRPCKWFLPKLRRRRLRDRVFRRNFTDTMDEVIERFAKTERSEI